MPTEPAASPPPERTGPLTAAAPGNGRPFPFWVLQVTELVIAVVLVDVSVHVAGGDLLVAVGGVLAVLAVSAQGPIGLVRLCPQRLHVALAVVAGALAAAAPLVPALRPDVEGIIVIEFAAIGLIRVATLTRTAEYRVGVPGSRRRTGGRETGPVIDATASVVASRNDSAAADPDEHGRDPEGESAARRAGRAAGAAAASGRRLAATHRPAAEAGVKRSIRHAGRWAGRLASRMADPESGR